MSVLSSSKSNLEVLADPLRRDRLREDDVAALDVPAQDHLRRRPADALGHVCDHRVVEQVTLGEG
jgi:hypothetical protein